MRLPRLRFTVRRMMVAVAVVGILLGTMTVRRGHSLRLATYHQGQVKRLYDQYGEAENFFGRASGGILWHSELQWKYERAARYPWLPVEPDPPEPEE
jgi:hypothetical protein